MVKSYTRFELGPTFGIISSPSSVLNLIGNQVAVGADEAVQVWDLKTGERLKHLVDSQQNVKAQVVQLAHEPQSQLIAAGYSDGSIRVWDMTSGENIITFNGHKTSISCLAFDESGTRLFSGSHDTTIIAWDLVGEQGIYRLKSHKAPVTGLLLIEGDWLVSTAKDGVMKLWELETQFCVETRIAHKGECWTLARCGDNRLITASNTTEMHTWEFDLGQPDGNKLSQTGTIEKSSKHRSVGVLYDRKGGYLIAAAGDAVQVWRERTEDEVKRALKRKEKRALKKGKAAEAAADIDVGAFLPYSIIRTRAKISGISLGSAKGTVVVNLGTNSVESWDYTKEDAERIHVVEHEGHRTDVRDMAISSDTMLTASGSNGLIKIFNVKSQKCIRTIEDTGYILSIRFLPGNALVVAGTKEGTLDVYDITKSVKIGSVQAHDGATWSLDVSIDGQTLVTGGADKTVKFWAITVVDDELKLRNTHKLEFSDDVLAVKLSPDNRLVAAALLDNTVKVYYRDTLKFFLNLYGHQLPVLSIDISHDSKILITSSADKNIKIWGLDFGDCHKSIFGHDDSILRVVFEPGTHNFVSASKDGLIKYWDGDKFAQIQKLQGHHSEVWALAFADDASFIVSGSHDKTMRIWEMTDEPLFIEEERENELEQQHEDALVESLDRDSEQRPGADEDADESEATAVTKHTIDSLKAGERLYEALDIAFKDRESSGNEPRHVILATLNTSGEQYLMDTLAKIRPSIVEDALLTFPLDRITQLLTFIEIWLQRKWNVHVVCRVLFFCLRSFHKQLVANRMLQPELNKIRELLQSQLQLLQDTIGYNIQQLSVMKDAWELEHIKEFDDPLDNSATKKREFASVSI